MTETCLILGAGVPDGLGGAAAIRFARAGLHSIVTGKTLAKVEATAHAIQKLGYSADAMSVDVTSEADLDAAFAHAEKRGGQLAAVLFNAGNNMPISFEDLTPEQFETFWRVSCFGGFLAAKRALPVLARQQRGTLIFTGASASLRGKPGYGQFAAAKGALRNLAQALAREYGPKGVHVAHVIIDGAVNGDRIATRFKGYLDQLGEDGALDPAAVADAFWMIHAQHRSAWTHELDLRPFKENW